MRQIRITLLYKFLSILTELIPNKKLIAKKMAIGSLLVFTACSSSDGIEPVVTEVSCYDQVAINDTINLDSYVINESITIQDSANYDSLQQPIYSVQDSLRIIINSDSSTHLMYRVHDLVSTRIESGGIELHEKAIEREFSIGLKGLSDGVYAIYFHFTQKESGEDRNSEMDDALETLTPFYIKVER